MLVVQKALYNWAAVVKEISDSPVYKGTRDIWEILVSSLFVCKLKTALKYQFGFKSSTMNNAVVSG